MTEARDRTRPDESVDPADAVRANNELWDEWTRIHEASAFYDLEGFKRGGIRIRDYERDEIGDVTGLELLHLQCHFGIDTLSWARLGAKVTGADISQVAVDLAARTAGEIGIADARFIRSDLDKLPDVLAGTFDVVYTSRGVLGWMPDIRRWAEVVAHFVRPGGRFYITEIHPVANSFENEGVAPGRAPARVPVLGASGAAGVRQRRLVRRSRRAGHRPEGVRLGPRPRRDRDGPDRRGPPDRVAPRVPVRRLETGLPDRARPTASGGYQNPSRASCRCSSRSWRRSPPVRPAGSACSGGIGAGSPRPPASTASSDAVAMSAPWPGRSRSSRTSPGTRPVGRHARRSARG